jgi:acylglycerol lipase
MFSLLMILVALLLVISKNGIQGQEEEEQSCEVENDGTGIPPEVNKATVEANVLATGEKMPDATPTEGGKQQHRPGKPPAKKRVTTTIAITHSEQRVTTKDETELYMQTWSPSSEDPQAHLLVVPGYMDHGGRYYEVGEWLASNGIAVSAIDLRGHGKSGGERALVQKWEEYDFDLEAALAFASVVSGDIPKFLLGHSNGATVILDYFARHPDETLGLQGVIVTSPWSAPADAIPIVKVWLAKFLGKLFPTGTLASTITVDQLTSDETKQQEHLDDPLLVAYVTLGWASQSLLAQERLAVQSTFPLPLLYFYATDDQVADPSTNRALGQRLQAFVQDMTLAHTPGQHELLNEPGRQALFMKIVDWIQKRI